MYPFDRTFEPGIVKSTVMVRERPYHSCGKEISTSLVWASELRRKVVRRVLPPLRAVTFLTSAGTAIW